jgi:hypothetical protein
MDKEPQKGHVIQSRSHSMVTGGRGSVSWKVGGKKGRRLQPGCIIHFKLKGAHKAHFLRSFLQKRKTRLWRCSIPAGLPLSS